MKKQIACLLSLLLSFTMSHGQATKGTAFPDPKPFGLTGTMPATKGKVVLYDFWASWCGPCRQAFPAYEKVYQKYKSRGFLIVAVGTDKKPADSAKFLKGLKTTFPVVLDHSQKFVAKVRPKGMPTAYLVGKDGVIIDVHAGFHGKKTIKTLEAQIEAALK
jgi:thiol-disulfide isomerase/thioredoxin